MKKILIPAMLFFSLSSKGQTLEDGKKFMYYERYKSAKNSFEQLVKNKPSDAEAVYWLGQAELGLGNVAAAKAVYQSALQQNNNQALLLAAMGEIELRENKTAEAKNRFESAITQSKSKSTEVLAAIARANINAPVGDANYAALQLQTAAGLKGGKQPSLYVLMGDAYVKSREGGKAMDAYDQALELDSNDASALYRKARIYESVKAKQSFVPVFEKAIEKDPQYAPAYYSLFNYWYYRDVNKAEYFLKKYISVIDEDTQNDYYVIDLKYVSKKYQEAIRDADALIQRLGVANVKPRIYRLKARSYKELNDLTNARLSADEFFGKAPASEVISKDYELYAEILSGISGEQSSAFGYYEKALQADSLPESRIAIMQKAVDLAKAQKDKLATAKWLERVYLSKTNPGSGDTYNLGRTFFEAGEFDRSYYSRADSVFALYTDKNPAQPYGHYWRARCNWSIDTSMVLSLANPHFEKFVEVASVSADSASFKPQIKVALKYFVGYNIFVTKDYKKALEYCDKILVLDPADKDAIEYKKKLGGKTSPFPQAFMPQRKSFIGKKAYA
jgi:tetratricopeptide (TPR) repeat protein